MASTKTKGKPEAKRGRPPKVIQPIPGKFENIIKALVKPVRTPKS